MNYEGQAVNKSTASNRPMSRIENDVATLKLMKERVDAVRMRVIEHARNLGYYEPTPEMNKPGAAPAEVIMNMGAAISDLDRAIDHLSGSLNVFD